MAIPLLPNTLRGDIEAKPKTAAISAFPLRIGSEPENDWSLGLSGNPKAVAKTAAVQKPAESAKPNLVRSLSFPLNEILRDYTGEEWYKPIPLTGGAVDLGLTIGSGNPVVRKVKEGTVLLNETPKQLTQNPDYWKNLGEKNRAYYNDQMNKLKTDLRSVFFEPPQLADY